MNDWTKQKSFNINKISSEWEYSFDVSEVPPPTTDILHTIFTMLRNLKANKNKQKSA